MKNEYKLEDSRKKIKFRINTGTVTIYRDNILVPTLYYGDQYEVKEKDKSIKVTQNESIENSIRIGGNMVINSCNSMSIVTGSNITIVNGKIVSGDVKSVKNIGPQDNNLEFAIPNNVDDLSFDISIDSGSLIARNIVVKNMEADIMSGEITMYDVDMLTSELEVMSGEINLEIASSILNYEAKLKAMCGKVRKDHIDTANNIGDCEKRKLDANVMSGNIKVLFKG